MLSPKGEHKSVEKVHVPAASANPRGSAHQIEFAVQIRKKREHVSRFLHSAREKVSAQELSDDFGTAFGPFLLVGETVVSRQPHALPEGRASFCDFN